MLNLFSEVGLLGSVHTWCPGTVPGFYSTPGTNVNTPFFLVPTPEFGHGAGARVQGSTLYLNHKYICIFILYIIVQRAGPYLLFARQDVLFPAPGKIYDESGRGLPEVRHYSQC